MNQLIDLIFLDWLNYSLDIDGVLAAIDKMLVPSEDKGREEKIIRAGYVSSWMLYARQFSLLILF